MKSIIASFFAFALFVPVASFAHPNHLPGAPDHPIDSPDYHATNQAEETPATDEERAGMEQQIGLLLQLIELLKQQILLREGVLIDIVSPSGTSEVALSNDRVVEIDTDYVTIYTDGQYRYFESNSIPNHDTGTFPNPGNPNTISEQDLSFKVTLNPVYIGSMTPVQQPGIALNGIVMEPGTAEREGDYNIEALQDTYNLGLDDSNAHVQPNGQYHYHGVPEGYLETVATDEDLVHVGYAADGFKMYHSLSHQYQSGWELIGVRADGSIPDGTFTQDFEFTGNGDLDECNGVFIDGTYAYLLTDEFPYIPRCLNGTPDESFNKSDRGGVGAGPGSLPLRP